MASTWSPNLKIELLGVGDTNWGTLTNNNFQYAFEESITGYATVTFPSDGNYNWAALYTNSNSSQEQRNLVLNVVGTLSVTRELIVPTIEKQYIVQNNTTGGQSITVKTAAGTGVTVPNGRRVHLYVDGTNVIQMVNYVPSLTLGAALPVASGGTGATTLTGVLKGNGTSAFTASNIDLATEVTGTLPVANGGTSFASYAAGDLVYASGTTTLVKLAIGTANRVLTSSGSAPQWVTSLTGLTGVSSSAITNTSIASGRVVYTTTGGLETSSANLLYSGGDLTVRGVTVGRGNLDNALNTAVGYEALAAATNVANTAVGYRALKANVGAISNTAVGAQALELTSSGDNNTAIGTLALNSNVSSGGNTAIGSEALKNSTAGGNTAVGYAALLENTTGVFNTAVGTNTLYYNTSGADNVAVGKSALEANLSGSKNIAIGTSALLGIVAGNTGDSNVAIGYTAMFKNETGYQNIAIGESTLRENSTGTYNVAVGHEALYENTTGSLNTASGASALYENTTGNSNTASGYGALHENTTGGFNTASGYEALYENITGNSNTALGFQAGYGLSANANTTGVNNTFIGNRAVGASATVSNVITLGNGSITTLRCQVTTITSLSDRRDKKDIVSLPSILQFVNALKPVSFIWNTRDGEKVDVPEMGFIAQDLQDAQTSSDITVPNLVSNVNPDKLEASPGTLIPVLVKAIQEQQAIIESLTARIAVLERK